MAAAMLAGSGLAPTPTGLAARLASTGTPTRASASMPRTAPTTEPEQLWAGHNVGCSACLEAEHQGA